MSICHLCLIRSFLINCNQWLDFPREGNGNSFKHARRQWNILDDNLLRYKYLNEFDKAMNNSEGKYQWLSAPPVSSLITPLHTYLALTPRRAGICVSQTRRR